MPAPTPLNHPMPNTGAWRGGSANVNASMSMWRPASSMAMTYVLYDDAENLHSVSCHTRPVGVGFYGAFDSTVSESALRSVVLGRVGLRKRQAIISWRCAPLSTPLEAEARGRRNGCAMPRHVS